MREELKMCLLALVERLSQAAGGVTPDPPALRRELAALASGSPGTTLHLVAEWQELHSRHDYDVLVNDAQLGGTLSLALRRDHDTPWALLGLQRWSERDVLRVNDVTLSVQDVIASLDFIWAEVKIAARLIDLCLMRAELERTPIEVSDEELQRGVDELRQRHGLHDVAATLAWMAERGLSHEGLERRVEDELRFAKLIERLVGGQVEPDVAERERRKQELFEAWLREQRRRAHIEWNWGDRGETERASEAARRGQD